MSAEGHVETGRPLESASTKSLLGQLFQDGRDLLKKEVELARAEVREEIQGAVRRVVGMAAAAMCAVLGVGLLCAALVLGLAELMAPWLAAVLVAAVMFAIAGVVFMTAKSKRNGKPLERTVRTLKEDVQWAKQQMV
jgi:hypothetical protein